MFYFIFISLMFVAMLLYFRIASYYNIIDKPNERSSHSEITIRGGGVIFLLGIIVNVFLHPGYWLLTFGALVIGIVSFIDDRINLPNSLRVFFHFSAVTLLFISLNLFNMLSIWLLLALYIFVIGTINAYNFMDGINGITGIYSLVVLGALQYVNNYISYFVHPDMIWLPILTCLVFLYFNFRKKAKCFAGDVGSITIAFWILFLLIKIILQTGNFSYVLFLAVYGVDAVLTIIHRLILKQNIFEAHRIHFYQILSNDQKINHLVVSLGYGLIQFVIILIIINSSIALFHLFLLIIIPLISIYLFLKPKLMKAPD